MTKNERIKELETNVADLLLHMEVLLNRVAILEMKAFPKVPAAPPVEWPSWKPYWISGPPEAPKYTITAAGTPLQFH